MQFWFGVAAGLLIGWISEWILGRRKDRQQPDTDVSLYQELDEARQQIARLESERTPSSDTHSSTSRTAAQPIPGQDNTSDEPEPEIQTADDLTVIKGIGPIFAERLNAAGIYTYADLATADPDVIEQVVAARQKISPDDWIREAKSLT